MTLKVFLDFQLDVGDVASRGGVIAPVIQPGFLSRQPGNLHRARRSVYAILSRYLNGESGVVQVVDNRSLSEISHHPSRSGEKLVMTLVIN